MRHYLPLLLFLAVEAYYPPAHWAGLLPTHNDCQLALNYTRQVRDLLQQQCQLRTWDEGLSDQLDEMRARMLVWDDACVATAAKSVSAGARRRALKRLMDRMGWRLECDFAEGLPGPGMWECRCGN